MKKLAPDEVTRHAGMLSAMGTKPRLQIMRLLLSTHPDGLVVGQIQQALGMTGSTLSHHLEKLRHVELVRVRREGTFLHYSADSESLQALLTFLYAECCKRSRAIKPEIITELCRRC